MHSNHSYISSLLMAVCAVLFGTEGSGMMIGNTGAFLAGKPRLPYDAEVEYLESGGEQWIDTGVVGNLRTKIEVEIEQINLTNHYAICGNLVGASRQITIPVNYTDGGLYARFGDKYATSGMGFSFGKYLIVSDRSGIAANGTNRVVFGATTEFSTEGNLFLFKFNGLDRNLFVGRMMSCKIYDGTMLVRDLTPVRFTNELGQPEGAMYDRANPTVGMDPDGSPRTDGLYRNRGTGAFTIGPDKAA